MKRIFLTTSLALALGCSAALAQQTADPAQTQQPAPATEGYGHHHGPNPQRQAEMLSRKLNLTPDQTSKIEPILASRDQQMEALHGNQQLTEQARHQQMHTIQQSTEEQLGGILTADQMTQLKAMRRNGREHRGPEGQPSQPGQGNQSPS